MNKHFLLALPFYIHLVILISAFMLNCVDFSFIFLIVDYILALVSF